MELEINGRTIETDAEGYLVNLEEWSPEVAEYLTKQAGRYAGTPKPTGCV